MTLTDFERVTDAAHGPGGALAWISDATGRPQPWVDGRHVPVAGSARRCAWRPDGARLLVLTDPDGREDHWLGELDPATGEVEWVVAEQGVRCEIGVPYGSAGDPYSADGALLAYASNARDVEVFDVLVRDANGSRIVLRGDDRYLPMGFSPDSRLLLVVKLHQNTEHELFVVDLATDTARRLTEPGGPAKWEPVAWLPDSSGIVVCTTHGRDSVGLATLSLTGEVTWLDTPESDVEGGALSRDGARLAWGRNEDGWTRLLWSERGGEPREVAGLPRGLAVCEWGLGGHVLRFTHDGRLLVVLARADAATELYLADLDAGTAERLTDFGARLPDDLVAPTVVHATSADGLAVPCLLYRPPSASPDAPAPVVMTVHGGPESQAYPEYDPMVQELLAAGIGVIAPNFRGSSGYGLRRQRAIYRDWGGGDLADLAAAADLLADVDWADGTRLGVHGASYGGFAALSCASRLPDRWRAAVSECGTSDLVTDVLDLPPTWRKRSKEWIGDPDDPADLARLTERSPLGNAHRVRVPVLFLHGENDTRVKPEESERMYRRLRELGKPARLELHPGVGHEVDREGWAAAVELIVGWFTAHL
ncbi:S9 family peptidase [Saccharothrix australiensis]|uniref:Dipeptidyl aminopeptidase/acylaminoacyl peptidase n=1 Tax=Saccharothrix australiensis TaxID=2072 RepID=A0A495W0N9_9PSEU|nr:alpha/beta fold hydrolase [Saccharothrix australiensis]RKT54313.1 dipeptidyl aminopeptidase/acylaminoacyl peptidase [Saccharothrix australiensis]